MGQFVEVGTARLRCPAPRSSGATRAFDHRGFKISARYYAGGDAASAASLPTRTDRLPTGVMGQFVEVGTARLRCPAPRSSGATRAFDHRGFKISARSYAGLRRAEVASATQAGGDAASAASLPTRSVWSACVFSAAFRQIRTFTLSLQRVLELL